MTPTRHALPLLALLAAMGGPQAYAATITITYVALQQPVHVASAVLDPPVSDAGLQGARLAVGDNGSTGRFMGQDFKLAEMVSTTPAAVLAGFRAALAGGEKLFVTDVPAPLLLQMADSPGAAAALLIDATARDDVLRNAQCRANVLHTLPDRAMLADGLMQYLSVHDWRRIMLLNGKTDADRLYADAVRASAAKFQIDITTARDWVFDPSTQQADTGHFQVNDEVAKATPASGYDVLVVADEEGNFGNDIAYRTAAPRPVAGTQGMVASAWSPIMDEYASTQLQLRFRRQAGRPMQDKDYGAWLAVRAFGEAATRGNTTDATLLIAFLKGPQFELSGYKGPPLSFRAWDGQLRQPILLADAVSLISVSPQPGFLHRSNTLDTLGTDQPETQCHAR